jgi:tripartite-type tricarboxylate transporter receptor subunit TctC
MLPDLSTVAESGLPGYEATSWHACSCPLVASTPEQFAAYIKEQRIKYDKLIKQIGLKGE